MSVSYDTGINEWPICEAREFNATHRLLMVILS